MSAFPDEIYTAPRSWAERAYPKLIHYNKLERAVISRLGNSRRCSAPRCVHRSSRCASRRDTKGGAYKCRAALPPTRHHFEFWEPAASELPSSNEMFFSTLAFPSAERAVTGSVVSVTVCRATSN